MSKPITCPNCGEEISGDYMSADPARRFFFAALRDCHANLKDEMLQRWPNPEIMRKHCLIAVGHCDVISVPCGVRSAAPGIANAFRAMNQYCIAIVKSDVVQVYTARSMSRRALQKKEFLELADKVFGYIHSVTDIDPSQAGRAA